MVYLYAYRGYRERQNPAAREHVFTISRDRANTFSLHISIHAEAVRGCEQRIGRTLLDAEQYAIAKLALFDAFDNVADLAGISQPIDPSAVDMETYLHRLGRV